MIRKLLLFLIFLLLVAAGALFVWGYAPDIPADELKAKYANEASRFVRLANGQRVHLRDEGPRDAPAIMLLHGSSASLHTWDGWAERLSDDYRIIRYDQPGHGLTGPHVEGGYEAADFVEIADAVADELGLETFVLAGNSMGGWVAWNYAAMHPGRLSGLILVDASGAPGTEPDSLPIGFRIARMPVLREALRVVTPRDMVEKSLRQTVADPGAVTAEDVDRYWELLRYPGNRRATGERGRVTRVPASRADLAAFDKPVLVMWGERDRLVPVSGARWFDGTFPRSTLALYPELGHIPMEEDAAKTADAVRAWMESEIAPAAPEAAAPEPAAANAR